MNHQPSRRPCGLARELLGWASDYAAANMLGENERRQGQRVITLQLVGRACCRYPSRCDIPRGLHTTGGHLTGFAATKDRRSSGKS